MITICGSMKKLKLMKSLKEAWEHVKVTIPDDSYYLACSRLIQHRADYLNKIAYSKLIIVVGEDATCGQYREIASPTLICSAQAGRIIFDDRAIPTLINPAQTGRTTMCNALRELGQALSLDQTQMDSKLIYHDEESYNALPKKTIGECVEGFEIGESTSYEMMWALKQKVPVLILRDNNIPMYRIHGVPDAIFPSKDRIFRCSDI